MQIQILEPGRFVRYKGHIGIIKSNISELTSDILFMDSNRETEMVSFRNCESPLYEELEDELLSNRDLRTLAVEADYVYIRNQDRQDYLNYCSIYN